MTAPRPRIAVLRPFSTVVMDRLSALGDVLAPPAGAVFKGETAATHLRDADAALITPQDPIGDDLLEAAPRLRSVSTISAGADHIDQAACARRGVRVATAPQATVEPTADLAFALLLAAARRLPAGDAFVRTKEWTAGAAPFWGLDVHHKTLGIVGLGRIGKAIARRAAAFSMPVLYHNRRPVELGADAGFAAEFCGLDALLERSDFVILQAPLTEETRGLIGACELTRMKASAVLINTGRGGLVDEVALVDALSSGTIAQAALDVFENEPDLNPRLLDCRNLILAPHVGTATRAARAAMMDEAIANLASLLGEAAHAGPATG